MNLTKLFETQKILRDRIGYNEPDRFDQLILALLVEIGVCANEVRCFKFWSHKPASAKEVILEEYVDGLHFLLEIGLEIEVIDPWQPSYEIDINGQFRSLYYHASRINEYSNHDDYEHTVSYFIGLGEMLGFTWEEIEEAYFAKNKINHKRQEEGY
jgi:dimeric dUTPase (all-alpha-NTP-PPase superfamily)